MKREVWAPSQAFLLNFPDIPSLYKQAEGFQTQGASL